MFRPTLELRQSRVQHKTEKEKQLTHKNDPENSSGSKKNTSVNLGKKSWGTCGKSNDRIRDAREYLSLPGKTSDANVERETRAA